MDIVSVAARVDPLAPLWPSLFLAIGAAAAVSLGIFRRRSIVGPVRLDGEEPVEPLTVAMSAGFLAWWGGSLLVVRLMLGSAPAAPDQPIPLNAHLVAGELAVRCAVVVVIVALLLLLHGHPRRLGISPRQVLPGLSRAAAGLLVVMPLMVLVLIATERLWQALHKDGPFVHDALTLLGHSQTPGLRAMLLLSIVLVAPISEELFFRGCVQTLLASWFTRWLPRVSPALPRWGAVLLVSLLFAWAHPWWSRPSIFVLAVCLGYAYERTGNLWTAVGIHAVFNAVQVGIFLIYNSGQNGS